MTLKEHFKKQIKKLFHEDYHDALNQKLWNGNHLRPEVREHLLKIANLFMTYLKFPEQYITDVLFAGSNANYNYTDVSDIDLHVVFDKNALSFMFPGMFNDYIQDKRKIFNDHHNISIHGYKVEVYPQDKDELNISSGSYSVTNDTWVKVPKYEPPHIDDATVKAKTDDMMKEIDDVLAKGCLTSTDASQILVKITRMRNAGLKLNGEFSVENLVFKTLRNNGYIGKVINCIQHASDVEYSLK